VLVGVEGVAVTVVLLVLPGVVAVVLGAVAGGVSEVSHCVRASVACRRSAAIALWDLVTSFWAAARLWFALVLDRPDGLATRGLVDGVTVGVGVGVGVVLVAAVAALWSDSRVALAWARAASASKTALLSGLGSRLARVSPAVTVSPTATDTLDTVPETAKLWLTWLTRRTDPVRSSRCSTEPLVTVVVR